MKVKQERDFVMSAMLLISGAIVTCADCPHIEEITLHHPNCERIGGF